LLRFTAISCSAKKYLTHQRYNVQRLIRMAVRQIAMGVLLSKQQTPMEYLIILRFIHIVSAVFWAGSVMYLALFIVPAVRALGPDGGKFMQQLSQTNKMPLIMTVSATLTVVGGILLIERLSGGFNAAWFGTPHGIIISLGGTLALAAYLVGMFVNRPTVERIATIGKTAAAAGGPPSPDQVMELQKLRQRLFAAVNITAWLVLAATIAMSVVRYF
jgi:uncharacterized membrane protein